MMAVKWRKRSGDWWAVLGRGKARASCHVEFGASVDVNVCTRGPEGLDNARALLAEASAMLASLDARQRMVK